MKNFICLKKTISILDAEISIREKEALHMDWLNQIIIAVLSSLIANCIYDFLKK